MIVMQQATFPGMERVIKCVDAHVNQLMFIIDKLTSAHDICNQGDKTSD